MASFKAEVHLCLKEYEKQRKLELIVSNRELVRPNTKKWQVIFLYSIAIILLIGAIVLSLSLEVAPTFKVLILVFSLVIIFELFIRFCLLQTVKCYQHYAKDETRRRCMCVPSCSEYATICLTKIFPLLVALIKIRKRLYKTCKGGEYRLDFPLQKMNDEFEKKYLA